MARVIGRNRGETYPVARPEGAVPVQRAFAFDQNSTSYTQIADAPFVQIAIATINLIAGSRVKVEGLASVIGSVAAGRAFISTSMIPGLVGSQSFGITDGLNFRTMNLLGITGPQPDGPLTIGLVIEVNGNVGARIDSAGMTVLTLTEILAT